MATLSRRQGWRTPTLPAGAGEWSAGGDHVAAGVDGEVRRSGLAQLVRGPLKSPSLHEPRRVDQTETFTTRDVWVCADVDVEGPIAVLTHLVAQVEHGAELAADVAKGQLAA